MFDALIYSMYDSELRPTLEEAKVGQGSSDPLLFETSRPAGVTATFTQRWGSSVCCFWFSGLHKNGAKFMGFSTPR